MKAKALALLAILVVGAGELLLARTAAASEYGCKVLLCMSNPGGPTQYGECVPPINQLWSDLAHGRPFPTCEEAPGSYASFKQTKYDMCKDGLTSLPRGINAITNEQYEAQKGLYNNVDWDTASNQPRGAQVFRSDGEDGHVCVGQKIRDASIRKPGGRSSAYRINVSVYDKIVVQRASGSGTAFDVYIDNQIHNRVLW